MLTAPIANAASTCGDVHAKSVPAHAQASRIAETPTLSTPAPSQSIWCSRVRPPGRIVRITTTSANAASGRLIQKIQRQETVSVSVPPSNGPATAAVAQTLPM